MTQEEKDKRIAELEKELAELKETPTSKRWQPKDGERYYYVGEDGELYDLKWSNDYNDKWKHLTNNCFKTIEEAEEHQKEIETYYKFKNYVEEHSGPLDWEEGRQPKWFLEYDYATHRIEIDFNTICKAQGIIYASSKQILRDAIDYIGGEEVAKRYLFGIKE